jgi:putative endonuclease
VKRTGDIGEQIAAEHLVAKGYEIVSRNWRFGKTGELDIVALDRGTLVVVEVKSARTKDFGDPLEWVTVRKQKQLVKLAEAYLANVDIDVDAGVRFDVVAVDLARKPAGIRHIEDAFRSGWD